MPIIETKTAPMVLNMEPHHPSMHRVLHLIVTSDGENVIDCEPVIGYLHRGMEKIAENPKIPVGEHYFRLESGKGEMGIFVIGNDNVFPWRWKIRMPDFVNLQILPYLVQDQKVADIVAILGSIDIIMGAVDR